MTVRASPERVAFSAVAFAAMFAFFVYSGTLIRRFYQSRHYQFIAIRRWQSVLISSAFIMLFTLNRLIKYWLILYSYEDIDQKYGSAYFIDWMAIVGNAGLCYVTTYRAYMCLADSRWTLFMHNLRWMSLIDTSLNFHHILTKHHRNAQPPNSSDAPLKQIEEEGQDISKHNFSSISRKNRRSRTLSGSTRRTPSVSGLSGVNNNNNAKHNGHQRHPTSSNHHSPLKLTQHEGNTSNTSTTAATNTTRTHSGEKTKDMIDVSASNALTPHTPHRQSLTRDNTNKTGRSASNSGSSALNTNVTAMTSSKDNSHINSNHPSNASLRDRRGSVSKSYSQTVSSIGRPGLTEWFFVEKRYWFGNGRRVGQVFAGLWLFHVVGQYSLLIYDRPSAALNKKETAYNRPFNAIILVIMLIFYTIIWNCIPGFQDFARLRSELRKQTYIMAVSLITFVLYAILPEHLSNRNFWAQSLFGGFWAWCYCCVLWLNTAWVLQFVSRDDRLIKRNRNNSSGNNHSMSEQNVHISIVSSGGGMFNNSEFYYGHRKNNSSLINGSPNLLTGNRTDSMLEDSNLPNDRTEITRALSNNAVSKLHRHKSLLDESAVVHHQSSLKTTIGADASAGAGAGAGSIGASPLSFLENSPRSPGRSMFGFMETLLKIQAENDRSFSSTLKKKKKKPKSESSVSSVVKSTTSAGGTTTSTTAAAATPRVPPSRALRILLMDMDSVSSLMSHLMFEYSPENLLAVAEMCQFEEMYASNVSDFKPVFEFHPDFPRSSIVYDESLNRLEKAQCLVSKYIEEGSDLELNISFECRQRLKNRLGFNGLAAMTASIMINESARDTAVLALMSDSTRQSYEKGTGVTTVFSFASVLPAPMSSDHHIAGADGDGDGARDHSLTPPRDQDSTEHDIHTHSYRQQLPTVSATPMIELDPFIFRECIVELKRLLIDSFQRFRYTEGFRRLLETRRKRMYSVQKESAKSKRLRLKRKHSHKSQTSNNNDDDDTVTLLSTGNGSTLIPGSAGGVSVRGDPPSRTDIAPSSARSIAGSMGAEDREVGLLAKMRAVSEQRRRKESAETPAAAGIIDVIHPSPSALFESTTPMESTVGHMTITKSSSTMATTGVIRVIEIEEVKLGDDGEDEDLNGIVLGEVPDSDIVREDSPDLCLEAMMGDDVMIVQNEDGDIEIELEQLESEIHETEDEDLDSLMVRDMMMDHHPNGPSSTSDSSYNDDDGIELNIEESSDL